MIALFHNLFLFHLACANSKNPPEECEGLSMELGQEATFEGYQYTDQRGPGLALADLDGDGWAACEECDDGDASIYPDADEVCDGEDNDCDGSLPADEVDDADIVILFEYDPYTGGHSVH